MGRKSNAKANQPPPVEPVAPKRSSAKIAVAALAVVAVAAVGFTYWRSTQAEPEQTTAAQAAPLPANLKAHPQEHLPPLQFPAYPTTRSREVISAAYRFAAEHPEVLSYIPCFCGCERSGHRGNEDCFVRARDVNGDVIEWEDHGMECAVCLDVATRAQQMYSAGKPLAEIRASIEHDWASHATTHTPTPPPPAN
jgi:hypothetical protein